MSDGQPSPPPPTSPPRTTATGGTPTSSQPQTPSRRTGARSVSPKVDRSAHNGGASPRDPAALNKSSSGAGHQRKGSNHRNSGSSTAGRRSSSHATSVPAAGSEGLAHLKNIISELKDNPSSAAPSGGSSSTSASPSRSTAHHRPSSSSSSSPVRSRQAGGNGGGGGHRKHPSGSASASSTSSINTSSIPTPDVAPSPSTSPSSTLNPHAGGFQPGSLGPIHDTFDESLVTPTATHFDLMAGIPRSPTSIAHSTHNMTATTGGGLSHGGATFTGRQLPLTDFSAMGQRGGDHHGAADFVGGFATSGGGATRPFAFPPAQASSGAQTSTQQQYVQMQQQQQAYQMQQQLAQVAALQTPRYTVTAGGAAAGGSVDANELMAEQMAIQQQLANLRVQQENLLARFGDMQAAASANVSGVESSQAQATTSQPPAVATQPPQHHRRGQSGLGSFGAGVGTFGQMGSFATGPVIGSTAGSGPPGSTGTGTAAAAAAGLPKGHGRRHSVNTAKQASIGSSQAAQQTFGGGFQFPNNHGGGGGATYGSDYASLQQQQQQQHEFADGPPSSTAATGRAFGHQRRTSGSMSSLGGWQAQAGQPANLAEASAHLQQLAAYRASAGHARIPSFGMSTLGGGPGQLAMAQYGGGLPQPGAGGGGGGGGGQQRKSLFAPYLPQASIPPLVQAGKLVIGTLRVNKRNRSDAYVATDTLDADIYICGSKDRNRALEGDLVAVELLDVDEVWGTKKDKEEKKRKKEENTSYDPRATRDLRKQDKKKDDVEVEGQGMLLFEDEEVNDEQKPQYAGHVVAVVERAPGQLFSGMLGVLRPSSAATQQKQDAERREREGVDLRSGGGGGAGGGGNAHHSSNNHHPQAAPRIIWFRPTDKRVPLIAIPTDQAPEDFVERPDKYATRLFVACIKRWPISSLHPFGSLVEELGEIGNIEAETNALLKDCNFSNEDFSESVVKCLPPTPWSIPEREHQSEVRRDFREQRVFTIDPETAKDLDDALHIIALDDGTYEVGVHIADVSHFVRPNTALDREARKRATTVYLVQRAVPMLPPTLSEELCSLNPGTDKLTFSVVFHLSSEGKVLSTWFGKTLINSRAKLAYHDVQEVLEGRSLVKDKFVSEAETQAATADLQQLAAIARQLKKARFENGALRIDNVKVSFKLDEQGQPEDCDPYVRKEAHELIEEYMLLANMSVARKIATGLPEQALLRRHEPPIDRRLDAFIDRMGRLGIELDGTSPGALMQSFNRVTDEASRTTLQHLSKRSMTPAKYFCTGALDISKYSHYALSVPLYTHFTSPIRRYADIIVHRQLETILLHSASSSSSSSGASMSELKFPLDIDAVSKIAQMCNLKKMSAKLAQEQSAHLMLCVLVHDLTRKYGPVVRPAVVIGVLDQAFDVLVVEFGIEKRVHVDQMPIESTQYDEHDNSLSIYWKKDVEVLSWLADKNNDEHLLRIRDQAEFHARGLGNNADKKAKEESALFDDEDEDETNGETKKTKKPVRMTGQRLKSLDKAPLEFQGLSDRDQHCIQTVRELQTVPVVITSDMTKSPPILKVHAINPYCST